MAETYIIGVLLTTIIFGASGRGDKFNINDAGVSFAIAMLWPFLLLMAVVIFCGSFLFYIGQCIGKYILK